MKQSREITSEQPRTKRSAIKKKKKKKKRVLGKAWGEQSNIGLDKEEMNVLDQLFFAQSKIAGLCC